MPNFRSRLVVGALLALCTASLASAQSLAEFQRHVLRGDTEAARTALRGLDKIDAATRATMQAALMPLAPRAMAMQKVARIFATHPIADTAIAAGCAALLSSQGHGSLVPGLDRPRPGRRLPKGFHLTELIKGFRAQIAARRAAGGDRQALADADWMLRTLSVNEIVETIRRIPAGGHLPVPSPLREEMELRFYPFAFDRPLIEAFHNRSNKPIDGGRLRKNAFDQTVPVPPPGIYMVELTAVETGWSRLESIVVSDLSLVTQSWPDRIVVMASLGDKNARPAANTELVLTLTPRDGPSRRIETRTDATGLATFALPKTANRSPIQSMRLDARHGPHLARLTPSLPSGGAIRSAKFKVHTMVDRPIYRPGDLMQGRLVLRHEVPKLTKTEDGRESRTFETRVVRRRAVEVHLWPRTKQTVVLRGRTDDDGVFAFASKLSASAPLGDVRISVLLPEDPLPQNHQNWLHVHRLFTVNEYRRPVILAAVEVPTETDRAEPFTATLRARYAAGAPAAGLRVDVEVHAGGIIDRRTLTLDDDGQSQVPVHAQEMPLPTSDVLVTVRAVFHSPDGQRLREFGNTKLTGKNPAAMSKPNRRFTLKSLNGAPAAGEPLRVQLLGKPGERVLLTTVRDVPLHSRVIVIGAAGTAEIEVATTTADFPGLQLAASLLSRRPAAPALTSNFELEEEEEWSGWYYDQNLQKQTFRLRAPGAAVKVALEHDKIYRPGARANMRLRVTRGTRPVVGTVAVTIVDETIYALERDRTNPPGRALQPTWRQLVSAVVGGTARPASAWHVLGRLLRRGRLDAPEEEEEVEEESESAWGESIGLGGGAGGKFGGRTGGRATLDTARTRKDFRPTAYFVGNLKTDAEGRVAFDFEFPDDLTRWRITAVAIDDTFHGAKAVSYTETRLPVSVTPVTPRILRGGDTLEIGILASQEATDTTDGVVTLQSDNTASIAIRENGEQKFTVRGKVPNHTTFHLRAEESGTAKLTARAAIGKYGDAAEWPIPVLPDRVIRPVAASELIVGAGKIALPRTFGIAKRQRLRLLGNRDALLREASEYLEGYPYGCVEQVLSRLTPLFVAARTTRLRNGGEGPVLSEAQALRLEAGMVALRGHIVSINRGFRWWRGNTIDLRMTALALHSLMIAREAGIDPERYGVRLRCDSSSFRRRSDLIVKAGGKLKPFTRLKTASPNTHDAELATALLRYDPKVVNHKKAVRMILDADQDLTPGLVARIGLALHAAGDLPGAKNALARILAGLRLAKVGGGRGTWFPFDRVAARTAHQLELALRVDPRHPQRAKIVGRLLGLQHDGRFGSTYSTAAALNALTLEAQLTGQIPNRKPITVRVQQGERERVYTLSKQNDYRTDCALADDGTIQVKVDGERQVHALLRGGVAHAGSTHTGWTTPLRVKRTLYSIAFDAAGKIVKTELRANAIPQGRAIELAIDVDSDEDVAYLVVDCPLPAGCEVLGRPAGIEVRDDRVVKLIRHLRAGSRVQMRLRMVPAHRGTVAWPPAVAQAMYQPDMTGASRGARLTMVRPARGGGTKHTAAATLTRAHYDAQLALAMTALRDARTQKTARAALRRLSSNFFGHGRRSVLPHVTEIFHRFSKTTSVLTQLHGVVKSLPESRAARDQALTGKPSPLGFLMLAIDGKQKTETTRWLDALRAMLIDDDYGGLSIATRRPMLLQRFDALVGQPWRTDAQRASTKDMLLHSDDDLIAGSLRAWTPVLRAAVSMLHSQRRFGSTRSTLPLSWLRPFEIEFGAAPSANWNYVAKELQARRWQLLEPLIAKGVTRRIHWLDTLNHTKDRDRLGLTYDRLFTSIDATTDPRAVQTLIQQTPHDLHAKLAKHLVNMLRHEEGAIRFKAFLRLPESVRAQLPEAVLRDVFAHSEGDLQSLRCLGDRGIRIVRQWLVDGREFLESDDTVRFLGRKHLDNLPLEAYDRLTDVGTIHHITLALARAKFSIADLQMAMHENAYGPWRVCLVEELGRRGAKKLLLKADDPLRQTYTRLLGAFRGDIESALEVARRLRADDTFRRGSRADRKQALPTYLRRTYVRSIAKKLRADEFLRWRDALGAGARARVLARFGLADWRYLLTKAAGDRSSLCRAVPKKLERTLLPELLALTRPKSSRVAATRRILATPGGEDLLREKLATRELPITWRRETAKRVYRFSGRAVNWLTSTGGLATHRDPTTGTVATAIRKRGFPEDGASDWTAKDRELMRAMLRRRGILPAPH